MRLEFIKNVRENDVLGKNILNSDGQILLKAGVSLTKNYIKKLDLLGVYYIYIQDDRLSEIQPEDDEFTQLKQCTVKSISNVVKNFSIIDDKQMKNAVSSISNLVDYILENKNVCKNLCNIRTYDNYTYMHCLDTGIMTVYLANTLNIKISKIKELAIGAILHDLGKIKVPYKIITKNGKLTNEEFNEIKKHPLYGEEMLQDKYYVSDIVLQAVVQHHERIDGKGYPYGLPENKISKYGKITSICDVYDAVSNNRCYRERFTPNEAYELILSESGKAFDKNIVEKFKNTFSVYPLGCKILLSNGMKGFVCGQNKGFPDRPIIKVFDEETEQISSNQINLLDFTNITVAAIV